ncbi:MAG: hypothetical protein ABIO85_08930 [Sphingomicrobium sp.]
MRKQMIETAALDVAEQVRTVEDVIDTALAELAELQARMMRARSLAHVGVRTGHDALEHVAGAFTALVSARGGVGSCHAALLDAKDLVPGLRTTSFGDAECPPKTASANLRIVA